MPQNMEVLRYITKLTGLGFNIILSDFHDRKTQRLCPLSCLISMIEKNKDCVPHLPFSLQKHKSLTLKTINYPKRKAQGLCHLLYLRPQKKG